MQTDTMSLLLYKISHLAVVRETPLIIQLNPAYKEADPYFAPDQYLATIGNVSVSFYAYTEAELVDLYAELKAGLEAEEAYKKASSETWAQAKQAYSNAKST